MVLRQSAKSLIQTHTTYLVTLTILFLNNIAKKSSNVRFVGTL